jgi:hypothetical protein
MLSGTGHQPPGQPPGSEPIARNPLPDHRPLSGARLAVLGLIAAALHAAFDAASTRFGPTTPPYLKIDEWPEAFQLLSPVAVSLAASCVSGVIAVIAVIAASPSRRRALAIGGLVAAFWILSASLTRLVWLSTPWPTALLGIALGVPRGLAIGWVLARLAPGG